jgi:hypothetical protein
MFFTTTITVELAHILKSGKTNWAGQPPPPRGGAFLRAKIRPLTSKYLQFSTIADNKGRGVNTLNLLLLFVVVSY